MLDALHHASSTRTVRSMRTTLNLSAEALAKVRQLAQQRRTTLGAVASELILKALQPASGPAVRNGVPIFPAQEGTAPDLHLVNRLRDQEP